MLPGETAPHIHDLSRMFPHMSSAFALAHMLSSYKVKEHGKQFKWNLRYAGLAGPLTHITTWPHKHLASL